jgi:hypothetical protein
LTAYDKTLITNCTRNTFLDEYITSIKQLLTSELDIYDCLTNIDFLCVCVCFPWSNKALLLDAIMKVDRIRISYGFLLVSASHFLVLCFSLCLYVCMYVCIVEAKAMTTYIDEYIRIDLVSLFDLLIFHMCIIQ